MPLAGGVGRLAVTAVGSERRGEHNGFITFHTNVADQPSIKLWHHMTSVGSYTISPKLVIFRGAADRATQNVEIGSRSQPPSSVSIVTTSHSEEHPFKVESVRSEGKGACRTTITIAYEPSTAFVRHATLRVCCGDDVIDVPIMALRHTQNRKEDPQGVKNNLHNK
jgi:hypothetical protein